MFEAAHKKQQVSSKAVKESPPLPDDIKTKNNCLGWKRLFFNSVAVSKFPMLL